MRSFCPEETWEIGRKIAQELSLANIVALEGELGAGKTTLAKGIISALTGIEPNEIASPTFTYMNHYLGPPPVYHFDLYRIKTVKEFLDLGLSDFFQEGLCLIEWPDRIAPLLPKQMVRIQLEHIDEKERRIALFKS